MRSGAGQPYFHTNEAGFGLLALVMVTTLLSVLALIAVPHVLSIRYESRVATIMATATHMQQALASYAASTQGTYPLTAAIGTWQELVDLVSTSGGPLAPLPTSPAQLGVRAMTYTSLDGATYTLRLSVDVPEEMIGKSVILTPAGITKE